MEKPGKGYKHFLKKQDIIKFLQILPNWEELNIELDAVILAKGGGPDGWYSQGVIAICAWEKDKTNSLSLNYFKDYKHVFDRVGVAYEIKSTHVSYLFQLSNCVFTKRPGSRRSCRMDVA
jgi:hypothetical protein